MRIILIKKKPVHILKGFEAKKRQLFIKNNNNSESENNNTWEDYFSEMPIQTKILM